MASPTAPLTPAPSATHHLNLASFLQVLERISIVALTLAPAIAAPFVRNPQSAAIVAAETPVAQALAGALAQNLANQPPA